MVARVWKFVSKRRRAGTSRWRQVLEREEPTTRWQREGLEEGRRAANPGRLHGLEDYFKVFPHDGRAEMAAGRSGRLQSGEETAERLGPDFLMEQRCGPRGGDGNVWKTSLEEYFKWEDSGSIL